jgi:hypothetical protein
MRMRSLIATCVLAPCSSAQPCHAKMAAPLKANKLR